MVDPLHQKSRKVVITTDAIKMIRGRYNRGGGGNQPSSWYHIWPDAWEHDFQSQGASREIRGG